MKYFVLDTKNNLLLQVSAEGDCFIPETLPESLVLPEEERCFDMAPKIGEVGLAFGVGMAAKAQTAVSGEGHSAAVAGSLPLPDGYCWMSLRDTWNVLTETDYLHACRASAWVYWERTNRFCPICGTPLKRHMDMGKKCPGCGAEHFPHLAPAVIVRISRGEEVLLVHARNFRRPQMYGLVAGFLEGGETLEQCVEREVLEETGIRICNIRYFGSQPWPYPSGVMVGFTADYLSGEVRMDDGELSDARFFRRDNLPQIPDKMSIARRLIDDWLGVE